ncbi:MAG: hypothetical protein U1A27_04460 [Phycisphaerae bacterium]
MDTQRHRIRASRPLVGTICAACAALAGTARAAGPDVIVSDLPAVNYFGAVGLLRGYAVGTTSCNIGDTPADWLAGTNQHPVIAQNVYRLRDGRFEQIGLSWAKHGFLVIGGTICGTCDDAGSDHLGVGCSDTYSAQLNGSQMRLGPRSEVNPSTGQFPYPYGLQWGQTGDPIFKRVQLDENDLRPALNPGALYVIEGHYIHPADAAAGNGLNNASYRPELVIEQQPGDLLRFQHAGPTVVGDCALHAWKDHGLGLNMPDPDVLLVAVDTPGDGRFWLASKATDLGGGTWHYEYAIENLNSHRAAGVFEVPIPTGAAPTNVAFHGVAYHSGEPYSSTPWGAVSAAHWITWSTADYASDPNADALRWSTADTFRFDCAAAPVQTHARIGLFRPGIGSPSAFGAVWAPAPADCDADGTPDADEILAGAPDCDSNGVPDSCQLLNNDCDANGVPDNCEIAAQGDCNGDGLPDACAVPPFGVAPDCNGNHRPDACDLVSSPGGGPPVSLDANSNLIPDECECPTCAGDLTGDARVNGDDVELFVTAYLGPFDRCADMDVSGPPLTSIDLQLFVARLLSGAPACP